MASGAIPKRFAQKIHECRQGSLDAATTLEFAKRLGVSARQLAAVAKVEAAGSGFDADGRPKILFERHKFHQFTKGEYSNSAFSNPVAGGYGSAVGPNYRAPSPRVPLMLHSMSCSSEISGHGPVLAGIWLCFALCFGRIDRYV
jgi:hypothetical protein